MIACSGAAIAEPEFATDRMTDEELRAFRDTKVAELRRLEQSAAPRRTAEGVSYPFFFCTLYYTPKESGFTAERGFDALPATAPGLGGRTYARDFLAAVKKEGFGRLVTPVNGCNYIQYAGNGRFRFAKAPLGSHGNVLIPRKSCAISSRNPYLKQSRRIRIDSQTVSEVTGSSDWVACDVGGAVHPLQIDLYWGEDEPMGPVGRQRARPAGTRMEYAFDVNVMAGEGRDDAR